MKNWNFKKNWWNFEKLKIKRTRSLSLVVTILRKQPTRLPNINMILVLYSCVITVWKWLPTCYKIIDIFLKKWLFKLFLLLLQLPSFIDFIVKKCKKKIDPLKKQQHIWNKKKTTPTSLKKKNPIPLYMTTMTQEECKKFTRYNLNCSKY